MNAMRGHNLREISRLALGCFFTLRVRNSEKLRKVDVIRFERVFDFIKSEREIPGMFAYKLIRKCCSYCLDLLVLQTSNFNIFGTIHLQIFLRFVALTYGIIELTIKTDHFHIS